MFGVVLTKLPEGFVLKYEVQGNSPVEIPQSGNDDGCDVGVCVGVGVFGGV